MDHRPADAQLGHSTHKPHYLGVNYYVIFLGRLGSNEFHLRLKKSKSWEPFWSQTILPIQPIYCKNGLNWQCCLAGSYIQNGHSIFFLIAMCADYQFEEKSIEI